MTQEAYRALRQPDPTDADRSLVDSLVKQGLGDQATGLFLGAMAKGVRGDNAHYGHAIVIIDPEFAERADLAAYYERVALVATEIGNRVTIAGNVTLDVTGDTGLVSDGEGAAFYPTEIINEL